MSPPPIFVEVCRATVGHDGRAVTTGVDLTVRAGELWVLLGPNGVGKSTLVHTILGLVPPLAGVVRLAVARERIGFVAQRSEVPSTVPTTVREFVSLGTVGTHLVAAERRARLGWALAHVGLDGLERHDLATLSGGQRQRALIARALVRRPTLLVLDEPTTHLDAKADRDLQELLAHLNATDGIAILMVMHDVETALRLATHVALFRDGTVHAAARDVIAGALAAGVPS